MNTVSVSFSGYRHTAEASAALWQWDYGQKLIIRGLNLPEMYEVHFCNPGDIESITAIGDSSGVSIPDELLETGKQIKAYIYLHDGADDGETEYEITIKVNPRAKPSDRLPRESERSVLDDVLALLNSLTGGQNQGSSLSGALNYTALINRPRINGKTLAGDMAGEELGLINAEDGKGLSSNDYSDAAKAIVDLLLMLSDTANNGKVLGIANGTLAATEAQGTNGTINGHALDGEHTGAELGLVDAEDGKGLSSNDYSNAAKALVDFLLTLANNANNGKLLGISSGHFGLQSAGEINGHRIEGNNTGSALGLVDAEDGKGLSSNDYTNEAKRIVDLLASLLNAENNGKLLTIDDGSIAVEAPQSLEQFATKEELMESLAAVQTNLTFDAFPESESQNPVTSDGIYRAIKDISDRVSAMQTAFKALMKDSGNAPKVFVDDQDILVIVGNADIDDNGYVTLPWATVENDIAAL